VGLFLPLILPSLSPFFPLSSYLSLSHLRPPPRSPSRTPPGGSHCARR
jgi:hypothetical protein